MIKKFKTRTGAIFCDTEKKMEYLYVGANNKEIQQLLKDTEEQ